MLLWKTSPSPLVRTEIARPRQPRIRRAPRKIRQVPQASTRDLAASAKSPDYRTCRDDEERYIFKIVLLMLLILVLPAILMLLYIFLNPGAFQYDITAVAA